MLTIYVALHKKSTKNIALQYDRFHASRITRSITTIMPNSVDTLTN